MDQENSIDPSVLRAVLTRKFDQNVVPAGYRIQQLHGGTLGDVRLIEGTAETHGGEHLPFQVVRKTQRKWERPGDPNSWRREYDLYDSGIDQVFTDTVRWPECYRATINGDETEIWLEYLDGISGKDLTLETLALAAFELGRFQGGLIAHHNELAAISCLGDTGFTEREHRQWHTQSFTHEVLISEDCPIPETLKQSLRNNDLQMHDGKSLEYSYLRSAICSLPSHIKQMLIDIDDRREELFDRIAHLPVVLCHRDCWIENVFVANGELHLIDWDTAGWGYLGEDIASLIIDETPAESVGEYYRRLVPAYYLGIATYIDTSHIRDNLIREMILLKFGYRILQTFMYAPVTQEPVSLLQAIYDMGTE